MVASGVAIKDLGWDKLALPAAIDRIGQNLAPRDYRQDGCTFDRNQSYNRYPYRGLVRRWVDCAHEGAVLYDGEAVAEDGSVIVDFQVAVPRADMDSIARRVMNSFQVDSFVLSETEAKEFPPAPDGSVP